LLYFRSGCELAGRDQAFFQEFKLRSAFDSDSKVDVAGGAARPQSMNVYQDEVAGRGARHEVFAIG
jgi:hypothetical protein